MTGVSWVAQQWQQWMRRLLLPLRQQQGRQMGLADSTIGMRACRCTNGRCWQQLMLLVWLVRMGLLQLFPPLLTQLHQPALQLAQQLAVQG
jgi:hypothetical protein